MTLDELLSTYWDAAYAEGEEGRSHDTEDGLAQRTLAAIHAEVARQVKAEREACAKVCFEKAVEYARTMKRDGDHFHAKAVAANTCGNAINAR